MPGDLTLEYQYDARGQLIAMTDWDDQQTTFAYDNAGRHIMTKRHNGLRSRYAYDTAGRLRLLRHDAGSKTLAHFAYSVDGRGNRTSALEALRQPGAGPTTIAHDDPEVVYSGSWSVVGDYHETTQTDASLHLLFFGGQNVTLKMGRGPDHGVYDIYIGKTLWQSIDGYNAGAAERTISIPLDGDGPHLLEIRNRAEKSSASSGYKLRFKSLAVDGAYTLHSIQYQYDALSRLLNADYRPADNLAATASRAYAYTHDVAGNRLTESLALNGGMPTVTTYSYNAANQITNSGFTFDNSGNLTDDGTNSYTWDRANRLLSMGGGSYKYAGDGSRIQQTVSSVVTDYLLDVQPGLVKVIAQTTGGDTERFIHSPRGIDTMEDVAGVWTHPLQDGLGSVRMEASAALAVDGSQNFAPYGTAFDVSGSFDTSFGFTGEQTDANGLLYLRARYYNPAAGVFTARDPFEGMMGRPMSLNGYSWVEGNVANASDPSGKTAVLASSVNSGMCQSQNQACVGGVSYIVQPGDTIFRLSIRFGVTVWEIAAANGITNINLLFPGMTLCIPGQPPTPVPPTPTDIPTPTAVPSVTIFFGGTQGADGAVTDPGPNPATQSPAWVAVPGIVVVPYPGSKWGQALEVASYYPNYTNSDLLVIGFSGGGDTALIFGDDYIRNNSGSGNLTGVAVLGGTMSGGISRSPNPPPEGTDLADSRVWQGILNRLLNNGVDVYILDDAAPDGGDAKSYTPPSGATGRYCYEERLSQPHSTTGLDNPGTHNDPNYVNHVLGWFSGNTICNADF